tara:strand:- start:5929 stop:7230 length:1302 start_codon:yes stop_codon:yes gene_type:complete
MNYFDRSLPDEKLIEKTINNIDLSLRSFYETKTNEDNFIRLHSSTLGSDELLAFTRSYLEGNITVGKYNSEYESLACDYFKTKYCVTSNSGSSANLLAISALVQSGKLNKGDKVIVPSLSWSTTVFPLVQYGLIPVFVDISLNDFNLSLKNVEECVGDHDIKAIMVIHTYGNPVDLDFLVNFCQSNGLLLIEDTCESMGASWNHHPIGSFGIVGTFSSYFSHHICTLEGGLTITKDNDLNNLMKSIRSHGWTRGIDFDMSSVDNIDLLDPTFLFLNIGYNLRLSDPQAAMGYVQIKKLDDYVKSRSKNANLYLNGVSNSSILSKYITTQAVNPKAKSSWFGFPILLQDLRAQQVKLLRSKLLNKGIETRPFLAGDFTKQPVNKKYKFIRYTKLNNIDIFHNLSFALPCHQGLTSEQIRYVCESLEVCLKEVVN